MNRQKKQEFIHQFSKECAGHTCMIIVRQTGLTADLLTQLRRSARENNVHFQIVKNRLAKRALQGSQDQLASYFSGPVGVFLSQDPIAAAKVVDNFGKKREKYFFPLAGYLDGQFVSSKDVAVLANLPTMDQMRSQLVYMLNSLGNKLVQTLNGKQSELARVLQAHLEKVGSEA